MNRKTLASSCLAQRILHSGLRIFHASLRALLSVLLGSKRVKVIWRNLPLLMKFTGLLAASRTCLPTFVKPSLFLLPSGEKILCPVEDAFVIDEIWRCEVYERFSKVGGSFVVVDVGAHVGTFAVKASKQVGDRGLVIACEAHPNTYALLATNLKNNGCRNVIPLNIALSDYEGDTKLYLSHYSGGNSLVNKSDRWIRVHVDTLDSVLRNFDQKHVDFIKIDVEGAELQVLRGAERVLKEDEPILSIAAYHTPTEAEEISEFLTSKGRSVSVFNSYVYAS